MTKEQGQKLKEERLGTIKENNKGELMKVIEYNSNSDIIVEFQDEHKETKHTTWQCFNKGQVLNPYWSENFYKDCIGFKNNNLTLVEYLGRDKYSMPRFNALCDCGNDVKDINYYTWKEGKICCCEDCRSERVSKANKREIIIGKKYGKFTPIEELPHKYGEPIKYKCLCECGNPEPVILLTGDLGRKERTNAGCRECNKLHLEGRVFGRLTVIKRDPNNSEKWLCKCDCGNPKLVPVDGSHLQDGHSKSCGCINAERLRELNQTYNTFDMSNEEYGICLMSNGSFIFDKEDYDLFSQFVWHIANGNISTRYNGIDIYASTLLFPDMNQRSFNIFYKNKDPLDLRRSNLEVLSYADKNLRKSMQSNNSSGVIGVSQNSKNSWKTSLIYHGIPMIKHFKTFEEAVVYRLQLERDYIGEYAPQKHLFEQYGIN